MIINRLNKLFSQSHELYLVIIIVIYVLFVSFFNRSFLSLGNLIDILNSSSVLIILAIGAMIVMVSGGIDISFTSCFYFGEYNKYSIGFDKRDNNIIF